MWQGVVSAISGTVGDVLIAGTMVQTTVAWAALFDDAIFAAGPVYLSEGLAGKLSHVPGDLGIYLGHLRVDGAFIARGAGNNPYLNHVHLQRTLLGKPAGTVVDPVFNSTQVITTPDAAQQGWLPASNTYFPGYIAGVHIPTGAKFGYNIQHSAETVLRQVFPLVPVDNAQFSQSGLVLYASTVVVNQYGIWWLDDTYSNAPWPVDYAATATADTVVLWTSRLMAQQDIVAAVSAAVAYDLSSTVGDVAVSRIVAGAGVSVSGTHNDVAGKFGVVTVTSSGANSIRSGPGAQVYTPAVGTLATEAVPATGAVRVVGRSPRSPRLGVVDKESSALLWWYDDEGNLRTPTTIAGKALQVIMDPLGNSELPEVNYDLEVVINARLGAPGDAGLISARSQLAILYFTQGLTITGHGYVDSPAGATTSLTVPYTIGWGSQDLLQRLVLRVPLAMTRPIIRMILPSTFLVTGQTYTAALCPMTIHSITYDLVPNSYSA